MAPWSRRRRRLRRTGSEADGSRRRGVAGQPRSRRERGRIERAAALGATELELVGDSELIVKQVRGEYKVKDPNMKPLHAAARAALADFDEWSIRHVKRKYNAEADRLVNETLDADG